MYFAAVFQLGQDGVNGVEQLHLSILRYPLRVLVRNQRHVVRLHPRARRRLRRLQWLSGVEMGARLRLHMDLVRLGH